MIDDLSERERTRLKKLAELNACADLSDEEYQSRYLEIMERATLDRLKGADLTLNPSDSSVLHRQTPEPEAVLTPVHQRETRITSLSPSDNGEGEQSVQSRPEVESKDIGLEVRLAAILSQHRQQENSHQKVSGKKRNGSAGNTLRFSGVHALPNRGVSLSTASVVFLLGVMLAIVPEYLGLIKLDTKDVKWQDDTISRRQGPVAAINFVEPLFGPQAVQICTERCLNLGYREKERCTRGCNRLSYSAYGRRITSDVLDPSGDASIVSLRCQNKVATLDRALDDAQWRASVAVGLERIVIAVNGDKRESQRETLLPILEDVIHQIRLSPKQAPEADALAEQLMRSLCVMRHQELGLAAQQEAVSAGDTFSEGFFSAFVEALKARVEMQQRLVLKLAQETRVLP